MVYTHFYYACKYLFTVSGDEAGQKIYDRLTQASSVMGRFWSDGGKAYRSEQKHAALSDTFDADKSQTTYVPYSENRYFEHINMLKKELQAEKQSQRLFVDMDGTLAVFRPVDQLETLYRKGYFSGLAPIENVVEAVKLIIREHPEIEVHVLSACLSDSAYALQEKNEWLDRYLPEVDAAHRIFPPCGQDKTEFVPHGLRKTDFLLDDYTKNLRQWEPPARGIKLLNGINHTRGTWQADRIRYDRSPRELASGIIGAMQGVAHVQDEHHGLPPAQEPSYERFGTPPPMAQAKPAAAPLQAVSPTPAPAEPPMAFPDPMGFEL